LFVEFAQGGGQASARECETVSSTDMNSRITRSILRWIHLVFAIPILGYVYSPFEEIPNYAPVVRFVAVPVISLTGLWMWKGHVVRRRISKGSAVASAETVTY
jgi:hypothetical protein